MSQPTSNYKNSIQSSAINEKIIKSKKKKKGLNFECDQEVESLLVATHIRQNSKSSINFNEEIQINESIPFIQDENLMKNSKQNFEIK